MNLDYYIKRKHFFKKRKNHTYNYTYNFIKGSILLCSGQTQRFNFVYIRFIKKLFRRKRCKVKMRFFKPKILMRLRANYIHSQKSKNARMGAGVGKFVRITTKLRYKTPILELVQFSYYNVVRAAKYLEFKCNLKLLLKYSFFL